MILFIAPEMYLTKKFLPEYVRHRLIRAFMREELVDFGSLSRYIVHAIIFGPYLF